MTMTTHTSQSNQIPLGAKLQSARETMRLERKDAAAQLRLNESVIEMIENNTFPTSMPQIFIRGYIRSYGKLLQLPEDIILAGLDPIKPTVVTASETLPSPVTSTESPRQYRGIMKITSAAIAITLIALAGVWWQSSNTDTTTSTPAITTTEEPAIATTVTPLINPETASVDALPAGISVMQPAQSLIPVRPASPIVSTNLTHNNETDLTSTTDIPAYKRAEQN